MAFGNFKDPIKSETQSVSRKLKWARPDPKAKYGKNIGMVGQAMSGKTLTALLFAFFNSEFKGYMTKYPAVVELLSSGILPEIERVVILESENNLRKALNDGIEKALFKPILDRIEIISIQIPRKEISIKNGRVVSEKREQLDEIKMQYVETVKEVVDMKDENMLFIKDSKTKFKKLLDDKLGLIVDTVQKRPNASFEGLDKYTQAFYAHRNAEWENLMEYERGFAGWSIDTFKESKTPQWVMDKDPTAQSVSTKWVTGTPHFLDVVFRIFARPNGTRVCNIVEGNSRYLPTNPKEWKFDIPMASRMGAMPLINCLCEKILLGEIAEDEIFW